MSSLKQSSPLNLFRALFPRWDFFDQIAFQFYLETKSVSSNSWKRVSYCSPVPWYGFFINPRHTLNMAKVNIIEHFASDIQSMESPDCLQFASYHLIFQLAQLDRYQNGEIGEFIFRVTAESPQKTLVIYESQAQSGMLP